ncbi:NADH dehydrogenase [ubiquinone] 1 alpha subcomplex subunit 4-like 2 isoform X2 [Petaurus breviceps papuanus]|uniref:NADH dehydrogenase [ubiquinone] 1 alpha subcomplex subunit 4-like 2 isoform X2 n=1 Tax=Petaurus breviceps papuanus TaxID=3040969 RepID=UPI0036DEB196
MLGTKFWDRFIRQIKRNPGLIPLISFIGLGMGSAALYLLRLALRSPDVRLGIPTFTTHLPHTLPALPWRWAPRAPFREVGSNARGTGWGPGTG